MLMVNIGSFMTIEKRIDDIDFTDYYYDQDDGYVDFLKTWGFITWIEFILTAILDG